MTSLIFSSLAAKLKKKMEFVWSLTASLEDMETFVIRYTKAKRLLQEQAT